MQNHPDFKEALAELEKLDIKGANVYLIDLLPLIDLMWADGRLQENERMIFEVYTEQRIDAINKNFSGALHLTRESVGEFFSPYFSKRPDPESIQIIEKLLKTVLISSSDEKWTQQLKNSLLATALDLASSNVTKYPYKNDDRFSFAEKECFFSLLKSID